MAPVVPDRQANREDRGTDVYLHRRQRSDRSDGSGHLCQSRPDRDHNRERQGNRPDGTLPAPPQTRVHDAGFPGYEQQEGQTQTPWATVAARDQPVPRPWATRPEARARIRSPASARLVNRFTPLLPPGLGNSTDCGYQESYACSVLIVLSIRRRRVAGRIGEC